MISSFVKPVVSTVSMLFAALLMLLSLGARGEYAKTLVDMREQNASAVMQTDAYGGWKTAPGVGNIGNPNGYFRTAKVNGIWWFVTPDGYPFVSKGVTDVNWLGANLSPGPFQDILIDKYGTEATWNAASMERLAQWGFNSIGPWSSHSMTPLLPHTGVILDSAGHAPKYEGSPVTDFWSTEFTEHVYLTAVQRATPYVLDKNMLGYFLDNELIWGPDHWTTDKTLLQLYLDFPAEAPGHAQALRFLREAAGDIARFNSTWSTAFTSWEQLNALNSNTLAPKTAEATAVAEDFMIYAFHRYCDTAITQLRRVDENHLILGCRFHTYPGDALILAAAEHFDVISMAYYEKMPPVEDLDRISTQADKPFLIEEWSFKSYDSGILNVGVFGIYAPKVPTQYTRAVAYGRYVDDFMSRPYAVGYHWYKWMDNPFKPTVLFSGDHCGLLNPADEPYEVFVDYVSEVNRRVEWRHLQAQ